MRKGPYTKPGRLAEVLALIQVLALGEATKRSELGIDTALLAGPSSADSWPSLAAEHPEFFRVDPERKHSLSLVARHAVPLEGEHRPPFSPEFTSVLLQTAITLHDRQLAAAERWKPLIPLWQPLIAGVLVLATSLLTLHFAAPTKASGRFVPTQDYDDDILLDTSTGQLFYLEGTFLNHENPRLPGFPLPNEPPLVAPVTPAAYSLQTAMNSMNSHQGKERRDIRYALNLPVS